MFKFQWRKKKPDLKRKPTVLVLSYANLTIHNKWERTQGKANKK